MVLLQNLSEIIKVPSMTLRGGGGGGGGGGSELNVILTLSVYYS